MPYTPVSLWGDMMPQTVSVEPRTGNDVYAKPTYGAAVTYPCRIVGKRRLVINAAGQQVLSQQTVYVVTNASIDAESRITLSTADTGSTGSLAVHPPIIATGRYPDENGAHHSVIFL